MSDDKLQRSALDLLWSLWTELGVPGTIRRHQDAAIDLEPLILFTPALLSADPRLEELVLSWCAQHAGHVCKTRLEGLFRHAPEVVREKFSSFSHTLRSGSPVRWAADRVDASTRVPWEHRQIALPLQRPALVRLRGRALCGVGARADVLCELLAREGQWIRAASLATQGYTKRSIARILSELAAAAIVTTRQEGNSLGFRLSQPESLGSLLRPIPRSWIQWSELLELAWAVLELNAMKSKSPRLRRVEATRWRTRLDEVVKRLWLPDLPVASGNPDAFEDLLEWGESRLAELAAGKHLGSRP